MSAPIKPPGNGTPPVDPSATDAASRGTNKPGSEQAEGFQDALERTEATEGAQAGAEVAGADALRAVADDLRSGRIGVEQAVDRLVQRVLDDAPARALPAAKRAELEGHLRRTLAEDPTLAGLVEDLQRGG